MTVTDNEKANNAKRAKQEKYCWTWRWLEANGKRDIDMSMQLNEKKIEFEWSKQLRCNYKAGKIKIWME